MPSDPFEPVGADRDHDEVGVTRLRLVAEGFVERRTDQVKRRVVGKRAWGEAGRGEWEA